MNKHRIELTTEEYDRLNSLYPESIGSGLIGRRAQEIVKIYFQRVHPECVFEIPTSGADLRVVLCDGSPPLLIEVKGTASIGVAWQQLKVSSRHSWRSLAEEGVPVYRVSEVFASAPCIYVLMHGSDFTLEEEARWTFKPVRHGDERHALTDTPPADSKATTTANHSQTSKYDALRHYLMSQGEQQVTLALKDAVRVLGFPLPASAYKHQAFWANQSDTTSRPWARAWQAAGYEVASCRLSEVDGWVRFRRHGSEP